MKPTKQRIAGLLNRIIFLDLARAVAVEPSMRKVWLRQFIQPRIIPQNYTAFRKSVRRIYNVQLPLDISPAPQWAEIENGIKETCNAINLERNLIVANTLWEFVNTQSFSAYPHEIRQLRISPHRMVGFEIGHYIVRDGRAIFQYPYPRSEPLTPAQVRVMLYLIKEAYCIDDFEDADVEILEMSKPKGGDERQTRLHGSSAHEPFQAGELEDGIASVHGLLLELAEE